MARNVEIKTRVADRAALLERAQALAGHGPERIEQDDTFFAVPHGRLKLRRFAGGHAELIQYARPDHAGARVSDYTRVPLPDAATADALHQALANALGNALATAPGASSARRVRKTRLLFLVGQTRVHVDAVEGLGDFMELEVVLRDEQTEAEGACIAEALLQSLGLAAAERIARSYVDLQAC